MRCFAVFCLCLSCLSALALDTDSLAQRRSLLADENNRYIRMALSDGIISDRQADSLRRITSSSVERPAGLGIDLLMQVREYLDLEYEREISRAMANEYALVQHFYSAKSMLPSVLKIPDDYVSPEERESIRQETAMKQLAESIARDFEREKLPAWQVWWGNHIRLFFGSKAWFKGKSTYFNGQFVPVPEDNSPRFE